MTFALSKEAELFLAVPRPRLLRFKGDWFTYEAGGFYREIDEELLRAEIRRANAQYALKSTAISNCLDEIKAATVVDGHGREPPLWLTDSLPAADSLIVCKNGILDPSTPTLYAHDDRLLTLNALPYDYDPTAPPPALWLYFLAEIFNGDAESIRELQKVFGYIATLDTSRQRIFAIIGPTRSGKGTIGRVLEAMIGKQNVCGPSFTKIGGDFGLQSFIGKQLALIADARLGSRTDKVIVAERLLSISGEDSLDVARKHRTDWHGKLTTRVLILSNELPALPDPSGSLAARFVAFHTPNSFLGREDRELTGKLMTELPGILNWALEGLRHVQAGEEIVTPTTARELIEGIEALGSPVKAFITEHCAFTPNGYVEKDAIWAAYRGWHMTSGLPGSPLSKEMFGRNLKTALPGLIRDYQPNIDGRRPRCWFGISLTSALPTASLGTGLEQRWNG